MLGVLVVDDSAVVRQAITAVLQQDRSMELIAAVADPIFALERMRARWPDVIVLDLEMPRMDGLTFLSRVMAERPTPVVVCSSLTSRGSATTLKALAAGAVTVVEKPRSGARKYLVDASNELLRVIRIAAQANVRNLLPARPAPVAALEPEAPVLSETTERVVAIGTSTGGTQALELLLSALPRVVPGILVVQHMPEKFTAAFAQRLDSLCRIEVKEAEHNDRVLPGRALIAPGGKHMTLRRSGAYYYAEVSDGPVVNHHRPSVDVLFRSVARFAGANALGIIMTGMGSDGALGLREMHDAGARTIAQDESSCVVFGMPKEAIKLAAVDRIVPLSNLSNEVVQFR